MSDTKNKKLVIIIVVLMVIIIGMVGFITINKINEVEDSSVSSTQTDLKLEKKAKELYENVVKNILYYEISEGNKDNFTLNDLSSIVLSFSKDSDYIQNLCGSSLENELINEGIISKQNEGQIDCKQNAIMKVDIFKKLILEALGKNYDVGLETRSKGEGAFEYSSKNQVVLLYYAGDICAEYKYVGYVADKNYLTIKVEQTGCDLPKSEHEVKFKIDGDNYYLYEVDYNK